VSKARGIFLSMVIIVILLISMSSCQKEDYILKNEKQNSVLPSLKEDGAVVDGGPVKGGTLKLFSTFPDTLDPITSKNPWLQNYFSLVFESMIKLNKNQKPIGNLADKWYTSEDGNTWTFHIRDGVVWQDGYPLTAQDVEFTIKTILERNQNTIYRFNLDNILSFTAIDRNTIEIVLKKPNAFTAELMTFPIISKRFYSKIDNNDKEVFATKFPPGTGPYSIQSYDENKCIKLTASRSWWKKKINENNEMPYIPDLEIKLYKNTREAFSAFQMGSVDVINVDNNSIGIYSGKSDVITKKYANGEFDFLAFNLSNNTLSDKYVRQAIASSLNKSEIVGAVLPGCAVEAGMPLIPNTWLYEMDEWVKSFSNNSQKTKQSDNVRELLIENGWEEYDGKLYKRIYGALRPLKFNIIVNEDNNCRVKVAEKIAEILNNTGMDVSVHKEKWNQVLKLVNSKMYDAAILGCTVPPYPDVSYLYSAPYLTYQGYAASSAATAATNVSGFENEEVSKIIEKVFSSNNPDTIKGLYSNLKNVINDEVPYIGLYFYYDAVFYNKNVRGNLDPYLWDEYNNITEWYISE